MIKKKYILIALRAIGWFCLFTLFEFVTGAVRFYSVTIDVPFMFVKYTLLISFLVHVRKVKAGKALEYVLILYVLLITVGVAIERALPLFSLPNLLSGFLGMTYGFMINRKTSVPGIKILIPVVVALFSAWYIFGKGFDHWCQVLDGDTFTGKTKPITVALNWKMYNKDNDTFTSAAYAGKIVYIDFWSTSCGVCFIKFPELEKLYQRYKNDSDLLIQAVNIPIERDTVGMAFDMIARSGRYSFPVVIGSEAMRKAFGIEAYPTVVILKDNKMVFRGRTELATGALENILETYKTTGK